MRNKIGIIGFGNMGSSIAEGLKNTYRVVVYDKDREKIKNVFKIEIAPNNIELVRRVNTIILSVKPQDFVQLLTEIKNVAENKLIISIAAGITTKFIEKYLKKVRIVRAMPNLPMKINKGVICICKGGTAKEGDIEFAKKIFRNFGVVIRIKENLMDAATAISGSGPGFLYDRIKGKSMSKIREYIEKTFIPSLKLAAKRLGFSKKQTDVLVRETAIGSFEYFIKSHLSTSKLVSQVASRGGTTQKGLEVLHKGGLLEDAIIAAYNRAKELSRS